MNQLKIFITCLLLISLSITVSAQNKITGKIVDTGGEPLIGASASIKGTGIGTISDVNGDFSLDATTGTLVVSYIGYLTKEIPIRGQSSFNIILEEDTKSLDEVIVVGYGTQKKASLTGAIVQISGDEAFKDRGLGNAVAALQGTVPGLVVTRTSTRPGSENLSMQIRGDISINHNSTPLVLIDGVASSLSEFSSMDPSDIESVTTLKDASAAIYGARSASGVILVTTKRGKKGEAKISYSGLFSTTIDGIKARLTTNEEWLDWWYEAQYQDTRANHPGVTDPTFLWNNFSENWWIFGSVLAGTNVETGDFIERKALWEALRRGDTMTLRNSATRTIRYVPGNYVFDELFGQATWQRHSLNVSGGDDRFGYMASIGFAKNQSQLKVATDGEKRYTGRLNMDYKANNMLKFETGMSFERRLVRTPAFNLGDSNTGGNAWQDPWLWPFFTPEGRAYDSFSGQRNPIVLASDEYGQGFNNEQLTNIRMNIKADLDLSRFLKGLSASATGAFRSAQTNNTELRRTVRFYDWEEVYQNQIQPTGTFTERLRNTESWTLGGFLNYQNIFNRVHRVSGMIGMTGEEQNYKNVLARRQAGPIYEGSDLFDLDVFVSSTNNSAEGGQNSWAFLSYVTRMNYAFNDKYLLEFLGRRDGSSRLHENQRWKNFFSLSGGWDIARESFLQSLEWLNLFKLKYSYGLTGSVDGIDNYERFETIATGSYFFGTSLASQPSLRLGNTMTSSTRTWETITKKNMGVDFSLLRNKLSGSFDYFINHNEGMFISVTYPSVLGASAPRSNNGKFETKGWEFALNWKAKAGNVNYRIGGFIADASSKVLHLENNENVPSAGINSNRLIGMPKRAIYVYKTEGIFQTQEEVDAWYEKYYWNEDHSGRKPGTISEIPTPATTGTGRLRPGARILSDTNGDGAITIEDLVYAGDAAPRMTFGIRTGFDWKGIDLSAFFQGVGKQNVLRSGSMWVPGGINYSLQNATFINDLWSDAVIPSPFDANVAHKGIHTDTYHTVASRNATFVGYNYNNKDISVQNSSYIRLKSLVVGYTLPNLLTKKVGISKARAYFSGDDLWEWTTINDGYDPEHGENTRSVYPFSRLISVGLEITF